MFPGIAAANLEQQVEGRGGGGAFSARMMCRTPGLLVLGQKIN